MTTSTTPPIEVVSKYFGALAEGRVQDALSYLDPDVKWFQPGENRFSGTHVGPDDVYALIGEMMTVSQGTFAIAPTGPLMVNGDLVVVPVHFTGDRGDVKLDQAGTDLITVQQGKIVAVHLFSSDGPAEDDFWGPSESVNNG